MIAATHDSSSLKDAETVVLKVSRFPFRFKYFVITDKEMKKQKYHAVCVRTGPKSNHKIVETDKIDTPSIIQSKYRRNKGQN